MAESRTTFEIERRRLARYFRVRWLPPLAVVFSLLALSTLPGADGDMFHPAVLTSLGVLAVLVTSTYMIAGLHVDSLKYWIDGTTLRTWLWDIQGLPFSLIGQQRHVIQDKECEPAKPPWACKADKATADGKTG